MIFNLPPFEQHVLDHDIAQFCGALVGELHRSLRVSYGGGFHAAKPPLTMAEYIHLRRGQYTSHIEYYFLSYQCGNFVISPSSKLILDPKAVR